MQEQGRVPAEQAVGAEQAKQAPSEWRGVLRQHALDNAMSKRAAGVPTYSVPEAAALLSISQEYLYRLIQTDGFPAVRMRSGRGKGRYVIPARAIEQLLDTAAQAASCVESADLADQWRRNSNSPALRRASGEA